MQEAASASILYLLGSFFGLNNNASNSTFFQKSGKLIHAAPGNSFLQESMEEINARIYHHFPNAFNHLKSSGCTNTTYFNIFKLYILPTECTFVFHMVPQETAIIFLTSIKQSALEAEI
jgi:hypothetical protein